MIKNKVNTLLKELLKLYEFYALYIGLQESYNLKTLDDLATPGC